MIDFWLVFGQLIPFLEVILLTAMECYRDGSGSGEEEMFTESRPASGKTSVLPVDQKNPEPIKKDLSILVVLSLIG